MKIIEGHTLSYLTPAHMTIFSDIEKCLKNQIKSEIANISILPAIPSNSKMIFLGDQILSEKSCFKI